MGPTPINPYDLSQTNPMARYQRLLQGGQMTPPPAPVIPANPDSSYDPSASIPSMAGGQLVTKPTIARLGEHGPEAVVPLKPKIGNLVQPDLLEGHITPQKVPGMRMSNYRHFTNRSF